MPNNIINRLAVAPTIARRHQIIVIPKAIRPIVRPIGTVKIVRQAEQRRDIANRLVPKQPTLQLVTTKPRALKPKRLSKRKNEPRLITPNASTIDLERIRNIRGIGRGRILVIIGNGPSLIEIEPEELRENQLIDTMSVNKPDGRVWPTKFWAYFDPSQLRRHSALIDGYNGTIFNSTSLRKARPNTIQLKNLGKKDFSRDLLQGFNIGRSSVYAAMQIGLWLDYDHIYILGCDMLEINGKLHFYGVNPDVKPEERKRRFEAEASYYENAAEVLPEQERKRFTFCSSYNPYPFVDKFGRLDHRTAIKSIIAHAERLKNGKAS